MTNNKFIRNYYPMLIVAVGFIIILLLGFFVFKFGVEKGFQPPTAIPLNESGVQPFQPIQLTEMPAPEATPLKPSGSVKSLCEPFTNKTDEITCEQATRTALKKYSGEIYYLERAQSFWIVGIRSDNTTVNVEVDLKTGEIVK